MEQAATAVRSRFRRVVTVLTAIGLLATIAALVLDRGSKGEVVAAAPGDAPGFVEAASLDNDGHFSFGSGADDSTVSGDGRYVAFATEAPLFAQDWATDVSRGSEADQSDVYVRDLQTGQTTLISFGYVEEQTFLFSGPSALSTGPVGRLGFAAPALPAQEMPPTPCRDFVDTAPGLDPVICDSANGASFQPAISRDGRFVAFVSEATNLRDHDDLGADTTDDGDGFSNFQDQSDTIDGSPIFSIYVHDRDFDNDGIFDEPELGANRTFLVSRTDNGTGDEVAQIQQGSFEPTISADGNVVAFTRDFYCDEVGDPPAFTCFPNMVLVRDRGAGTLTQVPMPDEGYDNGRAPSISADGQHVAFETTAENPTQTAVYDINLGTSSLVADLACEGTSCYLETPSISHDGGRVAFVSHDSDAEDPILQVHMSERNPATGQTFNTVVVSADPTTGELGDGHSFQPSISASGQYVAFGTGATNLHNDAIGNPPPYFERGCEVPDTDGVYSSPDTWCDVLVRDMQAPAAQAMELVTRADPNSLVPEGPNESSFSPSVSADGGVVTFETDANNLIPAEEPDEPYPSIPGLQPGDPNFNTDVYAWTWTPSAVAGPAVNFGNVQVGQQSVGLSVSFTHVGFGPLQGTPNVPPVTAGLGPLDALVPSISLANAAPGEFEFIPGANQCAALGLLHAGQTCSIGVVFRPQSLGQKSASVVTFFAGPLEVASVSLIGTGSNNPSPPGLSINPTSVDFGERLIGSPSEPRVITITNTTPPPSVEAPPSSPPESFPVSSTTTVPPVTISISTVTIGGGNALDYVLTDNQCNGKSLLPGQSCTITVVFTPNDDGVRSGFVQINDSTANGPHFVPLTGRAPTPIVQLNPALGPPGTVTQLSGANWPPNATVSINLVGFPEATTTTTDAAGKFVTELLLFPRSSLGERLVSVSAGSAVLDPPATFLVVASSMQGGPDFVFRR